MEPIKTGIMELIPGMIYHIYGGSNSGKTQTAMSINAAIARQRLKVLHVDGKNDHFIRRQKEILGEDTEALQLISVAKIFYFSKLTKLFGELAKDRHGHFDCIVVDTIGIICEPELEGTAEEVRDFFRGFWKFRKIAQEVANKMPCPILFFNNLNESKLPSLGKLMIGYKMAKISNRNILWLKYELKVLKISIEEQGVQVHDVIDFNEKLREADNDVKVIEGEDKDEEDSGSDCSWIEEFFSPFSSYHD